MYTNPRIEALLKLGEASPSGNWPNFLDHGFTCADLPDLLDLMMDEDIYAANEDSKAIWAPVHAWRTIGQLGCTDAIDPLIDTFAVLFKDDLAQTELPRVMGMIGESAITPLTAYLNQPGPDCYARGMAAESLLEIAKRLPAQRQPVVAALTEYLKEPDVSEPTLNACAVSALMDLSATESIETIREVYAKGLAEIDYCGDIEDVEIKMGLREKRTTPKPEYLPNSLFKELFRPSSDDPRGLANFYLARYGNEDSILDVSELDGFFAAITCSPTLIKPSRWMPTIWGDEETMPDWDDLEEANLFSSAVVVLYNEVVTSLQQDRYQPLLFENAEEEKKQPSVDEWYDGFMRGLTLWQPVHGDDRGFLEQSIDTLEAYTSYDGQGMEQTPQRIASTVQEIHAYFRDSIQAPVPPVKRKVAKVGRNAPCPCGSGKKYKKCCLH